MPSENIERRRSTLWRNKYLGAFVDTTSEYYATNIATKRHFSDGLHSVGYVWDCLRSPKRISFRTLCLELETHARVLAFADDLSHDRVIGAPLWAYPADSIAVFKTSELIESFTELPEDLYIFDESVLWTLVFTHEYTDKQSGPSG